MRYKKRIIVPKSYRVPIKDDEGKVLGRKNVYIGKKRIANWVDNFNRMHSLGIRIPAPWQHDPEAVPFRMQSDKHEQSTYNNAGWWDRMWQDQDGSLWGEVEVPLEDDNKRIGKTVKEVSLFAPEKPYEDGEGNVFEDAITHVALVNHAVAKDPDSNFEKSGKPNPEKPENYISSTALSLSMGTDDSSSPDPNTQESTEGSVNASGATVKDVVKMLAEVADLVLPDDTTGDNILERLMVALSAVRGSEESKDDDDTSVREPAKGAKEQPGPVAMATEIELALNLLESAKVNNPETNKPYTATDLKGLAEKDKSPVVRLELSQADQAAMNYVGKQVRESYRKRIIACVESGRVSPAQANELAKAMGEDKGLSLSFDDKGDPVSNHYDFILANWEAMPAGSFLTGKTPSSVAGSREVNILGHQAFSLDGISEESGGYDGKPAVLNTDGFDNEMSEEEADKIVNLQFASAGKSASQVEGGLDTVNK